MSGRETLGLLLVDKPAGRTSHDIVLEARRALGLRRVGHTGTLDPFATGLLLLLLGRATRLAEYFHVLPKSYEATLRLGIETDTEDPTGEVVAESGAWREVTRSRAREALAGWVGEREQLPPAYSAKQVGGRRAHDVARRGGALELAPAPVTIHALELTRFEPPDLDFHATVSTGTYVRALGRDVGRALGCGGHLRALRRTAIGPFGLSDAVDPGALASSDARARALRRGAAVVSWMPRREASETERVALGQGRPIALGEVLPADPDGPVAVVAGGELVAVARRSGDDLRPRKVFET